MNMEVKLAILGGRPLRDIKAKPYPHHPFIGEEEIQAVVEVLRTGILSSHRGTKVMEFEEKISRYIGVKYAIATCSGVSALQLALATLGVGPGDEVVVPAYAPTSIIAPVLMQNALPIFTDVDPHTYTIDPNDLKRKITKSTKAVIVVHLFGMPADMDKIIEVADEYNIFVIEDCSQAHGAMYKDKKVGSMGHIAVFSFSEDKNMTTGEGGIVVTDDDELAERVLMLRDHSETKRVKEYVKRKNRKWPLVNMLSYNCRMTELQAAIGIVQLRRLHKNNERRRRIAEAYTKRLEEIIGIDPPVVPEYAHHVFNVYCAKYEEAEIGISRKLFVEAVRSEGVPLSTGYRQPLYKNPILTMRIARSKGCPFTCQFNRRLISYSKTMCPVSESLCYRTAIWLPIYPELSDSDVDDIMNAIEKVVKCIETLKKTTYF